MESKKIKFSLLIEELVTLWMEWMKNYHLSIDESLTDEERASSVDKCEKLINREYEIRTLINDIIETGIDDNGKK